jgi:beta-N-acetylhexosaminidase
MRSALITGLAGAALSPNEAQFLRSARPLGIILFLRNCVSHNQIRALVADAKTAIGAGDVLVLIDQEGGRVQRLRPPLGRTLPPAAAYAGLYAHDPARACQQAFDAARLVAEDLLELGINTDCAPVLDVPVEGSHAIIGDRAYGTAPSQVAALGRAVAEGFLAGGVLPVIKHIPGHGRATKDSHLDLPIVTTPRAELSRSDFASFKALNDMPAAMTAHVVFTDIDPDEPASTSAKVTGEVMRGEIGFDGLLMSDDLSMQALSGSIHDRARAVIRAGSDVALHCNGDLAEMEQAAAGVPALAGTALRRAESALQLLQTRKPFDLARAEASLAAVIESHSRASESV